MIVFPRKIPTIIQGLEALLRRLPPDHVKRPIIEAELNKHKAGFKGEQSLDYYFDLLPEKEFLILHGLRLPYKDRAFQIDTLLLSKTFFILIEAKNLTGTVIIDDTFHQLIRIKETGEKEVFQDPIKQVQLQQYQFSNLLELLKTPSVPLRHLVVFTNPNTYLQAKNPDYVKQVVTSQNLIFKIFEMKEEHTKEVFSWKDLRKLATSLIKRHTPPTIKVLEKMEIPLSEIKLGVFCPKCKDETMIRVPQTWRCPKCQCSSRHAHVEALKEYALLMGPQIKRSELQHFLQIPSRYTALRLLKSLNLKTQGEKKNRKYILEFKH